MGFLKKLFGGGNAERKYIDEQGIYLYVRSPRGAVVKVRADKQHDLNSTDTGYEWHKTIVDSQYFQRMEAHVLFDRAYNIVSSELSAGQFITEGEYEAELARQAAAKRAAAEAAEDTAEDEE